MMTPKPTLIALGLLTLAAMGHAQANDPAAAYRTQLVRQEAPAPMVMQPLYYAPTTATQSAAPYQAGSLSPMPISQLPTVALPAVENARALKLDSAADSTVLPLTIPGYELRVMDITKKVSYDIGGTPVVAEVPIFIYLPRSPKSIEDSTRELRKLYNDLIMLYDQERVDKERVRSMLKRMDTIIDTFDSITPAVSRHASPTE